ncbi:GNAT family N-acetyltransferase [Denitrobaculum tricleocarpae]|uniref:GNAT family N-acetyltransferase n=1 Tax=Denitrobaculum tricleocarpae TaxID=2591009 RepID=A0A545T5L4_9PROT|nr:GNAT family N-acetyltransferase [Denitrobaculum tricleocarpae]TQV72503.1 GNAT family N-acetyltransferase [Denitrobaculum tricleocarpae]
MNPRPQSSASIPVVETNRLLLRGFELGDFDDHAALWADPDVVRHISGKVSSREESWNRFLRTCGHWSFMGFGYWALIEKETGRFAGQVGLGDFKRDIEPSIEGTPEMGWVLATWCHGRGYATEAVQAALRWVETHFGPDCRTVCLIDPENPASIRVAEKCGYREYFRTSYHGGPTILLERCSARS